MRRCVLLLLWAVGCGAVDEVGQVEAAAECRRNCGGEPGEGGGGRDIRDFDYAAVTVDASPSARERGISKYGLEKTSNAVRIMNADYQELGRLEFPGVDGVWKHYAFTYQGATLHISISEALKATRYSEPGGTFAEYRRRVEGRRVVADVMPGSDVGLLQRHMLLAQRAIIAIGETSNYVALRRFGWQAAGSFTEDEERSATNTGVGKYHDGFCSAEYTSCQGTQTLGGLPVGYGGGFGGIGAGNRGGDYAGRTCTGSHVRGIGWSAWKTLAAERARAEANEQCTNNTCIGCCAFESDGGRWEPGGGTANCLCLAGDFDCYCEMLGRGCAT